MLPAVSLESEGLSKHSKDCKHSLVLLKMGEIIARNMSSWLEFLINRYCCIYLVVYIILFILQSVKPEVKQVFR
jgi:hypothetical protein